MDESCLLACCISFCVGGYLSGTAMAKGAFGLSTALKGVFSYPCLGPPSPGLTFSALFCFVVREKVDMERVGREGGAVALACGGFFSGEREREGARVAEGVLLCEDEVLLVLPLESLVRSEALRERCSWELMSPMVDEMLCRETCLWRGGVVSTLDENWNSYWFGTRGGLLAEGDAGGRLMVGGNGDVCGRLVGVLGGLCRPPKKEGRREKMPWLDGFVCDVESASIVPARGPVLWIRGRALLPMMTDGSSSALPGTSNQSMEAMQCSVVMRSDATDATVGIWAADVQIPASRFALDKPGFLTGALFDARLKSKRAPPTQGTGTGTGTGPPLDAAAPRHPCHSPRHSHARILHHAATCDSGVN